MKNTKNNKDIEYYKKLPWTRVFKQNNDGSYFAQIKELDGCMTEGETITEANEMITDALECWLEVAIEHNIPIPEPNNEQNLDDYSGKILVRIPKTLHRDLIIKAARENVSLNAYLGTVLAKAV